MDQLAQHRGYIQLVLEKYHRLDPKIEGVESYIVFDTINDHYQLFSVGWEGPQRIYGCLIHVDLKDDKIWIQYDGTEYSVAQELLDLGVSPQSIVVAYHAPYVRQYTEFAVG